MRRIPNQRRGFKPPLAKYSNNAPATFSAFPGIPHEFAILITDIFFQSFQLSQEHAYK